MRIIVSRFKGLKRYQIVVGCILTIILIISAALCFVAYTRTYTHSISMEAVLETDNEGGSRLYSVGGISLPKGHYTLNIGYISDGESLLCGYLGNDGEVINRTLVATSENGNIISIEYDLTFPKDSGRISIEVPKDTNFRLVFVQYVSDKHIYKDALIWGIILILGIIGTWLIIFRISNRYNKVTYLVGIVAILITTIPTLLPGSSPIGGDLRAHLFRIEGVYFGLMDHQFPVVIYPEWNNNYGQLGILYPNIFLYIPAVLRLMGMSLYGMLKLSKLMINIVSAIVFFKSVEAVFDKQWMRIMGFLLLTFEYTRMYGIYNGGKLGGALLAEIFIPLIIAGIINLFYKDGKKWYYIGIGLAGVFCCHIISAVVSCLMVLIITLFNISKLRNKSIWIKIGKALGIFGLLILGSYVAFFKYYFVDWSSANLAWSVFTDTLWRITKPFFDPRWNSVMALLVFGIALLLMIRVTGNQLTERYSIAIFVTAVILFYLSTAYFPWMQLRNIPIIASLTDMLQSGNRFVGMVGELCAFSIPVFVDSVSYCNEPSTGLRTKLLITAYGGVIMLCMINNFHACKLYLDSSISIYDEVAAEIEYEAEDYLPAGTLTEYYSSDAGYISDENIVSTYEYSRAGSHILYTYTAIDDGEYVEFPKFYYPGYKVLDENGNPYRYEKGSRNRIRVNLPKADSIKEVHIEYNVPVYLGILYLVSAVSWIGIIIVIVMRGWNETKIHF